MERKLPVNRARAAQRAQDEANDDRTATEAEGERRAARQRNRDSAEEQTNEETEGKGEEINVAEFGFGVAEETADVVKPARRGDNAHAVRIMQDGFLVRYNVRVTAAHARDKEAFLHSVQVLELIARNTWAGHGQAAVDQAIFLVEVEVDLLTQLGNRAIQRWGRAVEQKLHAGAQRQLRVGQVVVVGIVDVAGSDDALASHLLQLTYRCVKVAGQAHRPPLQWLRNHALGAGVLNVVHTQDFRTNGGHQNGADNAAWVGQRITHHRGAIAAQRLDDRCHTRRRAQRTCKGTHADRGVQIKEAHRQGCQPRQNEEEDDDHHGHLPAAPAEIFEEATAEVQADDVNEDGQAKLVHERRDHDVRVRCGQAQGHEHRSRGAERDAEDIDLAHGQSHRHDEKERQQGLFSKKSQHVNSPISM